MHTGRTPRPAGTGPETDSGTDVSGALSLYPIFIAQNHRKQNMTGFTRKRKEMHQNDKEGNVEEREKIKEIVRMLRRLDAARLRMVYCYVLGML